jgi:hypothetical protein
MQQLGVFIQAKVLVQRVSLSGRILQMVVDLQGQGVEQLLQIPTLLALTGCICHRCPGAVHSLASAVVKLELEGLEPHR